MLFVFFYYVKYFWHLFYYKAFGSFSNGVFAIKYNKDYVYTCADTEKRVSAHGFSFYAIASAIFDLNSSARSCCESSISWYCTKSYMLMMSTGTFS